VPAERNLAQSLVQEDSVGGKRLVCLKCRRDRSQTGRGTFIRDDVLQDKPKLALNLMETVNPFEIIETRKIMEVKIAGWRQEEPL